MKNLLLLLKIFDSDFKLNYKKILSFVNLGIFLCWGCLIAAFITGAFESRLENRISSKNSFALYKLSLMKMQTTFTQEINFFHTLDIALSVNEVADRARMKPYVLKLTKSFDNTLSYLKDFVNDDETKEHIKKIERKIIKFNETTNVLINSWNYEKYSEITFLVDEIRFEFLDVFNNKILEFDQTIEFFDEEIIDYNKWSSLTFIITFLIQFLIFIFIQSFEISIERRKEFEHENK